jgi:hypothetical protein
MRLLQNAEAGVISLLTLQKMGDMPVVCSW